MTWRRLAVVAGLLLLTVPPLAWWATTRSAGSAGDPAALPAASPSAAGSAGFPSSAATDEDETTSPPPPTDGPVGAGTASPTPPSIGRQDARLTAGSRPVAAAPLSLRAPSIGVDAEIVPVGVTADGDMEVPADVATVGWYRFGPAPGAAGATVLAGHVDDREQGRGAFFSLQSLQPGDVVEMTVADGTTRRYTVTARQLYDKQVLPTDALFDRTGPERLVLITCGGDFDAGARSYQANVVVVAEPAA